MKARWTTYKAEYEDAARTLATARTALVQVSRECLEKNIEIDRLHTALARHHEMLSDEPGDCCSECGLTWDGKARPAGDS